MCNFFVVHGAFFCVTMLFYLLYEVFWRIFAQINHCLFMAQHNDKGNWGENLAVESFVAKGYAILERNWHCGNYEVDVIATRGSRIVFAEVKTRSDDGEDPLLAVNSRKMRRTVTAANAYIKNYNIDLDVQYDIVTITGSQHDYVLEHHEDVYFPNLRTYR